MTYLKSLLGGAALAALLSFPAQAAMVGDAALDQPSASPAANVVDAFSRFKPAPSSDARLDFEVMDLLVERVVLYMGPSLRRIARRPDPFTGTRQIKKHTSPYRMEGNKITYSLFDSEKKKIVNDYLADLIEIPDKVDLTSLSRKDQLAYWYNLHNLALVKEISDVYPEIKPKEIKPLANSNLRLHDAKILTIQGVPLSLRDIRENIVYRYWNDPIVIYGFHDGTLGSPSMPAQAFDRNNIDIVLSQNADEFINSLRGFGFGKVSPYYKDLSPRFFPNFEPDLRRHFKKYMRPEVYAEVTATPKFRLHNRLETISDTTGGYGKNAAPQNLYVNGNAADLHVPAGVADFIRQREDKVRQLYNMEWYRNSSVTIVDIETIDPDLDTPPAYDPGVDVDIYD